MNEDLRLPPYLLLPTELVSRKHWEYATLNLICASPERWENLIPVTAQPLVHEVAAHECCPDAAAEQQGREDCCSVGVELFWVQSLLPHRSALCSFEPQFAQL